MILDPCLARRSRRGGLTSGRASGRSAVEYAPPRELQYSSSPQSSEVCSLIHITRSLSAKAGLTVLKKCLNLYDYMYIRQSIVVSQSDEPDVPSPPSGPATHTTTLI